MNLRIIWLRFLDLIKPRYVAGVDYGGKDKTVVSIVQWRRSDGTIVLVDSQVLKY